MSESDVLVENPAWKVAREALQTIDDRQTKQEKRELPRQQEPASQESYGNQTPGFLPPPPPPQNYNYNQGFNYYPHPGYYGGYNQRPGPYPYPPYRQQYDTPPPYGPPGYRQDNYPMYNQDYNQPRPPPPIPHNGSQPHQPRYMYNQPHQRPNYQHQRYNSGRPNDEGDRDGVVYQRPQVHYEKPRNDGHAWESNKNDSQNDVQPSKNSQTHEYPSPWQDSSSDQVTQPATQKRAYSDVIKGQPNQDEFRKKPQNGSFKMTFIQSSGTKKFKPTWRPVESKPNNVEEKENSSQYEQEHNGQQDTSNGSFGKAEQLPDENQIQEKKPREWPPALKAYVKESFDRCKSEEEKDCLEKHFRDFLTRLLEDGTAYTIEWDKHPFPNMEEMVNRYKPQKYWKRRSRSTSKSRSLSRSRSRSPIARRDSKRGRNNETIRGRGRGKKRGRGRGQRMGKDEHELQKQSNKNWRISPSSSPDEEDAENSKRKQSRANRFHKTLKDIKDSDSGKKITSTLNVYSNADDEEDFDWSQFHIVGTCQDLTKRYLRLTSAPDPALVRPQPILEKSLEMVKQKWKSKPDYHFTCEQLKAIRQDLTVQRIRNDFTVNVYETHARIALEKGDREEFNQCQTCLKSLYKEGCNGHPDEFTAYKIIYDIYTDNYLDMSNCLVSLSLELKKSEAVKHALALRSAWVLCNYHYFFQLYLTAPNMSGYLIDLFAERVRKQALKIMLKSYRPSLPVKFIESELAFAEEGACAQWLKELGATFTKDSLSIDAKASAGIFNSS